MTKKNSYIELWRFLASLIIFSYHTNGLFSSGWTLVEFFFILSGFFAYRHIEEKPDTINNPASFPIKYTINKFKQLLPYTILGEIVYILYIVFSYNLSIAESVKLALFAPLEMLFLSGTGVIPVGIHISDTYSTFYLVSSGLWFIYTMFIALPVMLYLLLYLKNKIGPWLITFLPLLIYGYFIINDGTISGWHQDSLGLFIINLRALAGLLLGGATYELTNWWKKFNFKKLGQLLISLLEFGALGLALLLSMLSQTPYEVFIIFLFVISLSLILSEKTYSSKINSKLFLYLGKLSFPFYCFHCPLVLYAQKVYGKSLSVKHAIILFVASLIMSIITYGLVTILVKPFKKLLSAANNLLIK